jgi:hypothetical protein
MAAREAPRISEDREPSAAVLCALYRLNHQYERAAQRCTDSLRDREDVDLYSNGGLLISCSTRSIEPFPTYRAIQLKPGHAVLYYKLWHCVQQKHEGRKAIDDYSEANAPENSTLQVSVTRQ